MADSESASSLSRMLSASNSAGDHAQEFVTEAEMKNMCPHLRSDYNRLKKQLASAEQVYEDSRKHVKKCLGKLKTAQQSRSMWRKYVAHVKKELVEITTQARQEDVQRRDREEYIEDGLLNDAIDFMQTQTLETY